MYPLSGTPEGIQKAHGQKATKQQRKLKQREEQTLLPKVFRGMLKISAKS